MTTRSSGLLLTCADRGRPGARSRGHRAVRGPKIRVGHADSQGLADRRARTRRPHLRGVIPQPDLDRPGVAACELALAPESLDEYRTRIDANAKSNGRRSGKLATNRIIKDAARRAPRDDLGVSP